MKIVRSTRDGSVAPVALDYLGQIPEECLFYKKHELRHPLGIYNISLQQVIGAFGAVIEEYLSVTRRCELIVDGAFSKPERLLEYQKILLYSLREHIDDCYLILKTLVDPCTTTSRSKFTETYVLESRLSGFKAFQQSIAGYAQGYLSTITNRLKHQQARMRPIMLYGDGLVRVGYFIEEPDSNGVIRPAPTIHRDGNSAFSFARDILFNLFNLYYCSERLLKIVLQALSMRGLDIRPKPSPAPQQWPDLLFQAAQIRPLVFPDEPKKGIVSLRFVRGDNAELTLKYPDKAVLYRCHSALKFTVFTQGDGVSCAFKMPYCGEERPSGLKVDLPR
jgi:hypothetical protein